MEVMGHPRRIWIIVALSVWYQIIFCHRIFSGSNLLILAQLDSIIEAPQSPTTFEPQENHTIQQVPYTPFHLVSEQVQVLVANTTYSSESSYSLAKSITTKKTKWFRPQRTCHKKCCVQTVAIRAEHEEYQPLNTMDGLDLADIVLRLNPERRRGRHAQFHATPFHPDLIRCLQPGTVIHLHNDDKTLHYFWRKIRPRIRVPFVLITSDSDMDSPQENVAQGPLAADEEEEGDPFLLRWYGQNPLVPMSLNIPQVIKNDKFRAFPLGLSMQHAQSKYLKPYLTLTGRANPFANASRFRGEHFDWDSDVLVFFSQKRDHRKQLWKELCGGEASRTSSTSSLSCASNQSYAPWQVYERASIGYKFGLSPPGRGWDCYRTYEWLYLGIIPIIEWRPYAGELFEGLPVIFYHGSLAKASRHDITQTIQNFVKGYDFQETHAGWDRLFLAHWRKTLYEDAGRTFITRKKKKIKVALAGRGGNKTRIDQHPQHPELARKYYVGYRYETRVPRKPFYCANEKQCRL